MALGLLRDARGWPRWVHAEIWIDASSRLLHAVRLRSALGEHHPGRIPCRDARRDSHCREEISAKRKTRHRLSRACQNERPLRQEGGRLMATRAVEVAVGVPALAPERPVTWPKRTRARLSNGLEVILAEAHSIPKFHGELFFRSGNAAAVQRAPGLAEMTAIVARTGTAKLVSRQIEEDLRRIGADLSSNAGADTSEIAFSGLSEFAEPLLGLVNELAREASFPQAEFERERRQKLEEVKMQRTEPDFLASERLRKVLFGAHPYAQVAPSGAQVEAYKDEDLHAVYREFYTPGNVVFLLVGAVDCNAMEKHADNVLDIGTGKKPTTTGAADPATPD